jgi:hypothetical protein
MASDEHILVQVRAELPSTGSIFVTLPLQPPSGPAACVNPVALSQPGITANAVVIMAFDRCLSSKGDSSGTKAHFCETAQPSVKEIDIKAGIGKGSIFLWAWFALL